MKKNYSIASVYPFPFYIGDGHDTNFSLIRGNKIFSSEEGKISGIVNSQSERFPERSMLSACKEFDIELKDIDHWVFGLPGDTPIKPALKYFFSVFKGNSYEFLKKNKRIFFVNHHLSHASLAVYGSGLSRGAFLCLDDGGEESFPYGTAWGSFKDGKINLIGKYNIGGWGITRFHNFICEAIGYLGNVDNGKVMGLAGYGQVRKNLYTKLKKFLLVSKDGFTANFLLRHNPIKSRSRLNKLKLDSYQRYKVLNSSNPPKELKEITKYFSPIDIAATGQKVVEDVTLEVVKNIINRTKEKNIVCSGGFFQNVSFNNRLLELNLKNVYIPSAPNDAGLSLGAALYHKMSIEKKGSNKILSPYLGPSFSENEIENLLKEFKLKYYKSKNICKETAKFLSKGKIIGWFQGKSELGPRALGSRSVLADPRNIKNKAKINQHLKKRDWFMPYAPSILEEYMKFFFDNKIKTPYMSFALKIKKNSNKIPAAVHVDNTCRPQTVSKKFSPKFHELIKEFYKISKVPAVLNTSFNRHGIATIATPRNAIEHLLNGCVDLLAIEDFIVYPNKKASNDYEKILPEKHYVFIEKIYHIIEALLKNDKDYIKILKSNKRLLDDLSINFSKKDKSMRIKKDNIKLENISREYLWKKLIPSISKINF